MDDPAIVDFDPGPREVLAARLQALSELSPLEYDQQREAASKELGVRVSTLDAEVAKQRTNEVEVQAEAIVEELSPWAEPVVGADLLDRLQAEYRRHCIMQPHDYPVVAMLTLATFVFDAFGVFPKMIVRSPEKRCGKTVLLEVAESLVYRGLMASSITASAIFRIIDAHHPTLIIDEADTFLVGNEEMRGVINSSHRRRNAFVIRTEKVGDEFVPKRFTTWGPMLIAGIGSQADTIEDRSVIIELRRKLAGEQITKCPVDLFERNQRLRRQCLRWAEDHIDTLKLSNFEMPGCGNDRAADNWFPLFAIGRLIGDPWQSLIESAYIAKNAITDDEAVGVMLLRDVRAIMEGGDLLRIHSEQLVEQLVEMEDRPWPEWKHGRPMTPTSLSKLLKPYKIRSRQMKIIGVNRFGYERAQFVDAWERYIPAPSDAIPVQNTTPLQPLQGKALRGIEDTTNGESVVSSKTLKPLQDKAGSGVVVSEGVAPEGCQYVERF